MPPDDKPDEQKTERFNMFMSPSEMKAIDEWAWDNRVRSKSEAVRRLLRIGMSADRAIMPIIEQDIKVLKSLNRLNKKVADELEGLRKKGPDQTPEKMSEIMLNILRAVEEGEALFWESTDLVFDLLGEIGPMRNAEVFSDIEIALKKADEMREEALQRSLELQKLAERNDGGNS